MFRAARITAIMLVCLSLTGGHWILLQSVAWTKMLVDYSRGQTVKQAISDTFDGEHPCKMCVGIQQGKKQEKKSSAVESPTKIEGVLQAKQIVLSPPRDDTMQFYGAPSLTPLSYSPSTPPPKSLKA